MGKQQKAPVKAESECAPRQVLYRIGDKWSVYVIYNLAKGRCRFSKLLKNTQGISQRMLTTTLRSLERDGLIKRYCYAEIPPRVEYELTHLGQSLVGIIEQIKSWVDYHWSEVECARHSYDSQQ